MQEPCCLHLCLSVYVCWWRNFLVHSNGLFIVQLCVHTPIWFTSENGLFAHLTLQNLSLSVSLSVSLSLCVCLSLFLSLLTFLLVLLSWIINPLKGVSFASCSLCQISSLSLAHLYISLSLSLSLSLSSAKVAFMLFPMMHRSRRPFQLVRVCSGSVH